MKSVLLSIQPKWCEKIASSKKTIEVRKTKSSIPTPFKVYIYCTKAKSQWRYSNYEGAYENSKGKIVYAQQHVIGEFICDKVDEYKFHNGLIEFNSMGLPSGIYGSYLIFEDEYKSMCLSYDEVKNYGKGKTLYGWHISQLKIYDKPKEISEFYTIDESGNDCCVACVYHETPIKEMPCRTCTGERRYLYRPPQSWCYVQELEERK